MRILLAALFTLGLCAPTLAQDRPTRENPRASVDQADGTQRPMRRALGRRSLRRLGVDRPRRHDMEQGAARGQKMREKRMERFDVDGDGSLDAVERQAAREARQSHRSAVRTRVLGRFDADGDGDLSRSERRAAREKMRDRAEKRRESADTSGDGVVSPEERRAARQARREQRESRRGEFDKDGDGRLSPQERDALRASRSSDRPR